MRKCCPVVFSSSADLISPGQVEENVNCPVVFSSSTDFLQDKWRKVCAEMLPCGVYF